MVHRNGLSNLKNLQFDVSQVYFAPEMPILSPGQFGLKWADLGPVFFEKIIFPKILKTSRSDKIKLVLYFHSSCVKSSAILAYLGPRYGHFCDQKNKKLHFPEFFCQKIKTSWTDKIKLVLYFHSSCVKTSANLAYLGPRYGHFCAQKNKTLHFPEFFSLKIKTSVGP